MARKLKYRNFVDRIDIDRFEEAINFETISQTSEEDTGYCFDLYGLHTHGDTTGKLSINREKKVYNCWVCGGGSILDLTMELFEMDGEDAKEWLHQFVDGEDNVEEQTTRLRNMLNRDDAKGPQALPYFNEHALSRFELDPDHPWFRKRGIHSDVVITYNLRYNPEAMKRPPKNKPDDEPYVGPAILLPHFWNNRLVGWQYRFLKDDRPEWCKKYNNTIDFPKEETIFNFDRANDWPIVVESVPTTLFLESCGYASVSTFGASITEDQMKLLRRFHKGVILALDNDKAGKKARDMLTAYLRQFIPVYHMPFVTKQDAPHLKENTGADLGDLARYGSVKVDEFMERTYHPLGSNLNL